VAGATAATLLIVEYLKIPLDNYRGIPTRFVVLFVAFVILLGADIVSGLIGSFTDVLLVALNAFVVGLAATGAYQHTFGRKDGP